MKTGGKQALVLRPLRIAAQRIAPVKGRGDVDAWLYGIADNGTPATFILG